MAEELFQPHTRTQKFAETLQCAAPLSVSVGVTQPAQLAVTRVSEVCISGAAKRSSKSFSSSVMKSRAKVLTIMPATHCKKVSLEAKRNSMAAGHGQMSPGCESIIDMVTRFMMKHCYLSNLSILKPLEQSPTECLLDQAFCYTTAPNGFLRTLPPSKETGQAHLASDVLERPTLPHFPASELQLTGSKQKVQKSMSIPYRGHWFSQRRSAGMTKGSKPCRSPPQTKGIARN